MTPHFVKIVVSHLSIPVEYVEDGVTKYDIATGPKQVDIFDDYWDKYGSDFRNMKKLLKEELT